MALSAADLARQKDQLGQRVGILGGTFDPVHNGHLHVAAAVKKRCALDALLFIPAAHPPHKRPEQISTFSDRAAMLELAIEGRPGFFVSTLEAERSGPSYSIDTLRGLHQRLGQVGLYFVIGIDAFADLDSWKEWDRLLEYAHLVVIDRPPFRGDYLEQVVRRLFPEYRYDPGLSAWVGGESGRIYLFDFEPVAVSATEIRERAGTGQPICSLVPAPVEEYIRNRGLYKKKWGAL